MDSSLFHNLLDKYHNSKLNFSSVTAILIKLNSNKNIKNLTDLCRLHPLDKEGNNAPALNFLSVKLYFHTIQPLVDPSEIEKLYLDREVHAFLDRASQSVRVNYVKKIHRLSGKGVTIAVLDTRMHAHLDFTVPNNRIIGFVDYIHGRSSPYDDNGHGTHVAQHTGNYKRA